MTNDRRAPSDAVDLFPQGATVQCITCHGQKIEGEVMAFDFAMKLLALKKTDGGRSSVVMVNMAYVKDFSTLKEPSSGASSQSLPNVEISKVDQRIKAEMNKKSQTISSANVTLEARRLFCAINKAYDNIAWNNADIVVLKKVVITPPYNKEDVALVQENDTRSQHLMERIQMMVERHINKHTTDTTHSEQQGEDESKTDEFLEFSAKIQPVANDDDDTKDETMQEESTAGESTLTVQA